MQDDPNLNQNPNSTNTSLNGDNSAYNPQQIPQNPISTPYKESMPISSEPIVAPENYIEVSEKEPQIAPEVESAGVYKVSDKLKLDQDAKNAGLTEAKDAAPVDINGTKVVLPMTPAQAKIDAKGNPSNSITWLASEVIFAIKRLGDKNAK